MKTTCCGHGPCAHVQTLLDSAERIMKAKVRTGSVTKRAAENWLNELEKVCDDCPTIKRGKAHHTHGEKK